MINYSAGVAELADALDSGSETIPTWHEATTLKSLKIMDREK
jgi:hypothetical protein